jgi:hypothetical protein
MPAFGHQDRWTEGQSYLFKNLLLRSEEARLALLVLESYALDGDVFCFLSSWNSERNIGKGDAEQ